MKRAANEVLNSEDVTNVTASFDGTWQRRGFSSKNGIATAVTVNNGSSKVIDTKTMSNYCNKCSIMVNRLSENNFKIWYKNHKPTCSINYIGSAGTCWNGKNISEICEVAKTAVHWVSG